ncbi:MAG: UxaA family hydrolase [Intestinimonas sp.]
MDGVYAWPHPYGCSQIGEDQEATRRILCGLIRHPNAGGVLVLGLGCENSSISVLQELLGGWDSARTAFLECQAAQDELAEGRPCCVG